MVKLILDLKRELRNNMLAFDMIQRVDCSKEDNMKFAQMIKSNLPLPEGVYQYKDQNGFALNQFYAIYENNLSDTEKQELLTYKKLMLLRTIKNCCVFFSVLTVIGIIAGIIAIISQL